MARWKVGIGDRRRSKEPLGPVSKATGSLFFAFFLGIGGFFVFVIGREAWRDLETWAWTERRCEITRSAVLREGGEEPYRAVVAYRTVDGGSELEGADIGRRPTREDSYGDAAARLAAHPTGSITTCYAGPGGELVLERGSVATALWTLFPMIFVAIGAVGLVAIWRPRRTDRFGRPLPEVLGDGAGGGGSARAMVVLGALIAAAGGVIFWFVAAKPLLQVYAARDWDHQACTVEHSRVLAHDGDDGATYSIDILYRWERGSGVERSSRYSFFGGSSSGRAAKAKIVRAHPRGAEVTCWVDPGRRNEAVLERGLTTQAWVAAVPLAFLLVGGGVATAGRRAGARRARMRERALRGEAPIAADDPLLDVLPPFDPAAGPVPLRSETSRRSRVIGLGLMAIFWIGIVSVFVNEAWEGHARGRPDWFLSFFLVPFALVGVGLVAGTGHALLALRNPRPVLVANTASPRLGGRLEVQWRFEGSAARISRVRLAVKGLERATYQVGTDSHTVSEDFFEEVLVDRPATSGAIDGTAAFTFPSDVMHSFQSEHNHVIWQLELSGEARRWPDVNETYPLVLLPRGTDRGRP